MDGHTDIHLAGNDGSQITRAEGVTTDHEHEHGNTASNGDSVPDLSLPSPSAHPGLVKFLGEQSPVQPFKSDEDGELTDVPVETVHEHNHTVPRGDSGPVVLPAITEEAFSECVASPAGGPTSLMDVNDTEALTTLHREPPLSYTAPVSAEKYLRDEREMDLGDCLNPIQMLHTEPDRVRSSDAGRMTDEEEARGDSNFLREDFLPSLPPSSSPPQLFSSSPCASSQSSGDVGPSKMLLALEVEHFESPYDCPHDDHLALIAQDDPDSESADLCNYDTTEVETSPGTGKRCLETGPTYVGGNLQLSRKRSVDRDELSNSQSVKRLNLDFRPCLAPTPKRATEASQKRQLRKLAAPFRPPLKHPLVAGRPDESTNSRKVEPTTSTTPQTNHDKVGQKRPVIVVQSKASNTPKSLNQFKSPLVNKNFPADSRSVRLTPALQGLERKLQLLKRAIKVKEANEEGTLEKLAEKWVEAGREAAYEVWDATKDTADFAGKMTSTRKSYSWGTSNGNTPWGWETKSGDTGEESCALGAPDEPCKTGYSVSEEDDDVGSNTLGTMLRQLGIDPDILGWDDEKEVFSD